MKIMVTIEVLGTGCAKCKRQMANVERQLKDLALRPEIKKWRRSCRIVERGVMMLPAIIIDGDLKVSGQNR